LIKTWPRNHNSCSVDFNYPEDKFYKESAQQKYSVDFANCRDFTHRQTCINYLKKYLTITINAVSIKTNLLIILYKYHSKVIKYKVKLGYDKTL